MKTIKLCATFIFLTALAALALNRKATLQASGSACPTPPCPAAGSGAAGVAGFSAACSGGCSEGDTATTCNGQFSIKLDSVTPAGDLKTFQYTICKLPGAPHDLSHVGFGLGQIDCLAEGASFSDLVVDCAITAPATGYCEPPAVDPTTQLFGVKFNFYEPVPTCVTVSITLDESALAEGKEIGTGCVTAATKAGNQDITRDNRPSPGYACVCGPVCIDKPQEVDEGCTPGYWKNHLNAWGPTGFAPADLVGDVFENATPYGGRTLSAALSLRGGPGVTGAKEILLRAAVAALLNAAHPDVNYCFDEEEVIEMVNNALASGDRATILALADVLDVCNNAGCPLD